ncbi:MAG: deoxyribodipyrimidine photo-lyase [Cognaticolwellia sp.]
MVWLKRDLRLHDHAPLCQAVATGHPVLVLYVFEPGLWALPEYARCQFDFVCGSLAELDAGLRECGARLIQRSGRILDILQDLHQILGIASLHSHQETGVGWTFGRDRAVARFCQSQQVPWHESMQDGVFRAQRTREGWRRRREAWLRTPQLQAPEQIQGVELRSDPTPSASSLGLGPSLPIQPAGSTAAEATLESFRRERALGYRSNISSPAAGWDGCSRLSPHLAFGTVSLRRATHQTLRRLNAVRLRGEADWAHDLDAFLSRLAWRDHFMQRLESQPDMEFQSLHHTMRGLRGPVDPGKLQAWRSGRTGYPMVDACMRSLVATKWLNFRMRAMVVSFAAYDLWQPWRSFAPWLGAQFLDFEPGIHYSQVQMQSGSTGINALRIYDVVKQAKEQDPAGDFVRRWIPELAQLPAPAIFTPWTLSALEREALGCTDYPRPIVDHRVARQRAHRQIEALRRDPKAKAQAQAVHQQHGSRLGPMSERR